MKKILNMVVPAAALCALTVAMLTSGCLTSKQQTVTNGVTNTVVVVNQAALLLDTTAASVATTLAVNTIITQTHNDPGVIGALKNAQIALTGVINGATPATTQDIINALKAQGNPVLANEITQLVAAISQQEQAALVKYGATAGGQIALAFAKAVNSGLMLALQGL